MASNSKSKLNSKSKSKVVIIGANGKRKIYRDGYDKKGYDFNGFNKEGKNKKGFNKDGYKECDGNIYFEDGQVISFKEVQERMRDDDCYYDPLYHILGNHEYFSNIFKKNVIRKDMIV